jgi:osmotically-inducible protein OsmY
MQNPKTQRAADWDAVGAWLPETQAEAEALAESIEQAVRRETGRQVRDLSVEITREGVLLRGRCDSFHCKQLAQHAAMTTPGGDRVTNRIEVA